MNRILVQTVGTGRDPNPEKNDPGNPVWEALAYVVDDHKPNVLVQLCSTKTEQETIPRFEECLGQGARDSLRDIRRESTKEVDDVEKLTIKYAEIIGCLQRKYPRDPIYVDFTSGTKAMSAALVAAAISRGVERLLYAVGKRDDGGRAYKTEKVVSLNSQMLIADRQIDELGRLFNLGHFAAVRVQAERLGENLTVCEFRAKAESLEFLGKVYDNWDRFVWTAAAGDLQHAKRKECLILSGWDVDQLDRQYQFLEKVKKTTKSKSPTAERLADLFANANRCIDNGRYDDAVARLYRLVEYIGQARLCEHGIVDTSRVPISAIKKIAPGFVTNHNSGSDAGCIKLGLCQNIKVLNEARDPVGEYMYECYFGSNPSEQNGPLGKQLTSRNNSYLGHGESPVKEKHATGLNKSVAEILEKYLDEKYPADGPEKLQKLLQDATFAQCPWVTT